MTEQADPLKDFCQTPGYGLEPLLYCADYAADGRFKTVWDPCAGEGYLANAIRFTTPSRCLESDLKTGSDFLVSTLADWSRADAIITNPPFSKKLDIIEKCIESRLPWALLMESNTISLGGFHSLIMDLIPEIGIVWFSPRINFKMPNKKWAGGGSHFPTAWFTWGFGFSGNRYIKMTHWSKEYRAGFQT